MTKPLTLRLKWKLFQRYLKEAKDGVVVTCSYCGSFDIAFNNQREDDMYHYRIYTSNYTCNNCGATCRHTQKWTKESTESKPEPETSIPNNTKDLSETLWRCTDEDMDEYGMVCSVVKGEFNPDANGENEIEIEYEDETIAYMKYRRFVTRFKQIL